MAVDTVIAAHWIIPVEPHGVALEDHALAIEKGRIVGCLPVASAAEHYPDAAWERLDQHALIPGLVNTHTHAAMNLLRGVGDDLPLARWLAEKIWPLETKFADEAFVRDGTRLAMAEMLRGGVTCFNDMYFFPDVAADTILEAGMRARLGLIVIDFPTPWAQTTEEYFEKGTALHHELQGELLLSAAWAPHAPYTVNDDALRRVQALADAAQIPVHIHLHETRAEIDEAVAKSGQRPVERLRQLGLVGPNLIGVHMTQLTDAEITLWADSGAHVAHCPESNLKLASGFCPTAKLLAAGVNVALGTDGAASNNDLDLLGEMRTAALLAKAVGEDASAAPAATALRMATLNGAKALGLAHEIGTLEPGKWADLTAIRLSDLETQPLYDPISHIVYAANRRQVTDVWVAGRRLLRDGALTTLDPEAIIATAQGWCARISRSLS